MNNLAPILDQSPAPANTDIPTEWLQELGRLNRQSHEYREMFETLQELGALSVGDLRLVMSDSAEAPITDMPIPDGYKSAEPLRNYQGEIETAQFEGIIHSLATGERVLSIDVTEFVTDGGKKVRLCDLRPFMSSSVRKGGPESATDVRKLDALVARDLKVLAETGSSRNKVTGHPRVGYTKMSGTKVRAYWMPIVDTNNSESTLTIARIADCGDSVSAERDLYNAVFNKRLRVS